ncbi:hypothetical protein JQ580_19665 [Bradyrhizobium japonicum]|uniref:hypothetical protein n=1 Tax=Bradyrhizobium japonicum TaxID=375 RepID=UPI001BAA8719|nr:hypothetical protein [Bradyrhizobium japonicum]MBR0992937.1 hypothetical protein [Bradyrhizobium japonicum]
MNFFIRSDSSEAGTSEPKISELGNFKSKTAALALGTIAAVTLSLALASAATTSDDHRREPASGATVQKSTGRCKAPTALAM